MDEALFNSQPSLRPGDFVHGRFRVGRLLGMGGNGAVYRAVDTELNNGPVALKCVCTEWPADSKVVERFSREVLLTRRLRHPHIVAVYEIIAVEERAPIVVMEVVEGGTLATLIQNEEWKRVPLNERIELLRQIASALAYAHDEGIVHRDVKPENILLTIDGDAKVADFGLGRCFDDDQRLTKTGASLGTPYYMSPEQFRGEDAGPAADMYSFGILSYELLFGRKPFTEEVYFALALKHLLEPLPVIAGQEKAVPSWILPLLMKCTAKNSNERFSSMQEVVAILEEGRSAELGNVRSEAVLRLRRGERSAHVRRGCVVGLKAAVGMLAFVIILQLTAYFCSLLSPDMTQRMVAVALKAETVFGSTMVFPLKRLLGIDQIQLTRSSDLFRGLKHEFIDERMIKALVMAGADLNVRDEDGNTPLLLAGDNFHTVFYLMLEKGADINARGMRGMTPFTTMVTSGLVNMDKLKVFFPQVDLRIKDDYGRNALHFAVGAGSVQLVRAISADPRSKGILDDRDINGYTALHFAAVGSIPLQPEVIRALMQGGANPALPGPEGQNALHLAIISGNTKAALEIARNSGQSVLHQRNNSGRTPRDELLGRTKHTPDEIELEELLGTP